MTKLFISDSLVDTIAQLLEQARLGINTQVNHTMIHTYRHIGREIVEFKQQWSNKAQYGESLINTLSQKLTERCGKWFSGRNLRRIMQFYLAYPNWTTVSSKFPNLSRSHHLYLLQIDDEDKRNDRTKLNSNVLSFLNSTSVKKVDSSKK